MADEDLDDVAGLPDELGVGEDLARSQQRARIRTETRTYGKTVTIVYGLDPGDVDLDDLASTLKSQCAAGGTVDDGEIEVQGEHQDRVRDILRDEGFTVEN
jgi:translation initiation factor 1